MFDKLHEEKVIKVFNTRLNLPKFQFVESLKLTYVSKFMKNRQIKVSLNKDFSKSLN